MLYYGKGICILTKGNMLCKVKRLVSKLNVCNKCANAKLCKRKNIKDVLKKSLFLGYGFKLFVDVIENIKRLEKL